MTTMNDMEKAIWLLMAQFSRNMPTKADGEYPVTTITQTALEEIPNDATIKVWMDEQTKNLQIKCTGKNIFQPMWELPTLPELDKATK